MNENKKENCRRDLGHDALSACGGMAAGTCRLPSTASMYLAGWQLLEQKGPNGQKKQVSGASLTAQPKHSGCLHPLRLFSLLHRLLRCSLLPPYQP